MENGPFEDVFHIGNGEDSIDMTVYQSVRIVGMSAVWGVKCCVPVSCCALFWECLLTEGFSRCFPQWRFVDGLLGAVESFPNKVCFERSFFERCCRRWSVGAPISSMALHLKKVMCVQNRLKFHPILKRHESVENYINVLPFSWILWWFSHGFLF